MMRFNQIILVIGCIALVASGCNRNPAATTQTEIKNVRVTTVESSSLITNVEYAGKFRAGQEISITPKAAGRVATVNFKVGDTVKEGDVLFTLEAREIQAQLEQQQASLDIARANYDKTKGSSLDQQMMSAEQNVNKFQVTYNNAKYNFDKVKDAYARLEVPKETLMDAQKNIDNALLDLNNARENLRLLKEKSGPQSVDTAAAQVRQSEAGLKSTQVAYENTIIRSPISGRVATKEVEAGEIVSGAAVAYTIIDTRDLVSEVSVSDKMVDKISKGQKLSVKVTALDKTVEGIVENVSPQADDKTQTYVIKILIPNPEESLKSGMFVRVLLPAEKKENILTVPNRAIKIENGIQFVYIVAEGKVKKVAVQTGLFNEKVTEVMEGLQKGASVILEGQIFLNEGEAVNIVS